MHLTFQEGKGNQPLAVIRGGKYSDEVVFLSEHEDKADGKQRPKEDQVDLQDMLKGYKPRERSLVSARLNKALRLNKEPEEDILPLYKSVLGKLEHPHELTLYDGKMVPIPDPDERSVLYCFGAAGSGKSFFTKNWCVEFHRMHPKATIYMFSRKAEDPSFDKDLKLKRVLIDDALAEEKILCDDFPAGSMIVFDDIDSLPKKQYDAVHAILIDVLNVGRQRKLYCCVTSHLGADGSRTRGILNETHCIVGFPHGSSPKAHKYVLESYGGLDKEQIKRVLKLPSRWYMVKRTYPPALVYETGAYLLHK